MNDCALIIFAKLPRVGEVKTRLGKSIGMEKAAEIYKQFAEDAFTLADAMKSQGVTIYVFFAPGAEKDEVDEWVGRDFLYVVQAGENLGERMQHAFERTFADGAKRSVVIGTDIPELDSSILDSAFKQLPNHDIVLGPSTDGGYYLLGMNPPIKQVFVGIEWSTEKVLQQTLDCLESLRLSYTLLSEFADVDTVEDYQLYLTRTKSS